MMLREELIANCKHYTGTLYLHEQAVSLEQLIGFAFDEGYMAGTHFHQFMDTVEVSFTKFAEAIIARERAASRDSADILRCG